MKKVQLNAECKECSCITNPTAFPVKREILARLKKADDFAAEVAKIILVALP